VTHVATFRAESTYPNRRVVFAHETFYVEDLGTIEASMLPQYYARGEMEWVSPEMAAWVQQRLNAAAVVGGKQGKQTNPALIAGVVLGVAAVGAACLYLFAFVLFPSRPGVYYTEGQALPPVSVLVDGQTYLVNEIEVSGSIQRGDTVRVRLTDTDYDGEYDYADIVGIESLAGQ